MNSTSTDPTGSEDKSAEQERSIMAADVSATVATSASRDEKPPASKAAANEPLDFVRNFGDLFAAAAIAFFLIAIQGITPSSLETVGAIISLILVIVLSEYVTRKRKLVLPSIVLAIAFTAFTIDLLSTVLYNGRFGSDAFISGDILSSGVLVAIVGIYYYRYQLPFTLALIGVLGLIFLSLAMFEYNPLRGIGDIQSFPAEFTILAYVYGMLLFSAAMWFELQKDSRTTSNGSRAFWLHVVAVPVWLYPLGTYVLISGSPMAQALLVALLIVFSLTQITIDRRIGIFMSLAFIAAIWIRNFEGIASSIYVMFFYASIMLCLALFWYPVRAVVLNLVPDGRFKNRLTPQPD